MARPTGGKGVTIDPCTCGRGHGGGFACTDAPPTDGTGALGQAVEETVLRAVFPHDATRRAMLTTFGAATLLAAIGDVLPLGIAREAFAQTPAAPEKRDLKIGFIAITCATPIIMAEPMGY